MKNKIFKKRKQSLEACTSHENDLFLLKTDLK